MRRGKILKFMPLWTENTLLLGLWALAIPVWVWCIGALYFSNLPWEWLRVVSAWTLTLAVPAVMIFFRHYSRNLLLIFGVFLLIYIWYLLIPASHDGDWRPGNQCLPEAVFDGHRVTIHNIRNYVYRSENDFTEQYETREYDMNKLRSLDAILSYWDNKTAIAHMLLSFGFDDGKYLAISVETRLRKDQVQSGLRGFYKQYGIIGILADERDLLRLRTDFRKEQVYLYRLKMSQEEIELVFRDILRRVNKLKAQPGFYNTLTFNCLKSLIPSLRLARDKKDHQWDFRLTLNGFSDELMWERKLILGSDKLPFEELKKRSLINQYLPAGYDVSHYSELIRQNIDNLTEKPNQ